MSRMKMKIRKLVFTIFPRDGVRVKIRWYAAQLRQRTGLDSALTNLYSMPTKFWQYKGTVFYDRGQFRLRS